MVGIRIRHLPEQSLEKTLKIYFSKPEHGGGKIQKIYHPLMNNDAVIIFEDQKVMQTITQFDHKMAGSDLEIEILPEHMIFSTMEAKVDMNASVILHVSPKLRDEMEFGENIRITENQDETYSLTGNWFQLEWAWNYLDSYMKHQEIIQIQIEQNQPVAMETCDTEADKRRTYRVRPSSPTEVNSTLRKNLVDRTLVEETLRSTGSPRDPVRGTSQTNMARDARSVLQSDQSETDERRSSRDEPLLYHKSIGSPHESLRETTSPHSSLRRSPSPQVASGHSLIKNVGESLSGLKENIDQLYSPGASNMSREAGTGYMSRLHVSDDYDTEDEIEELHGKEHLVPFESVHSSLGIGNQVRRAEENKTFDQFAGMQSAYPSNLQLHLKGRVPRPSSIASDSGHNPNNSGKLYMETTTSPTRSDDVINKGAAAVGPLFRSQYGTSASPRSPKDYKTKVDVLSTGRNSTPSKSKLPNQYSEDQLQCKFLIKNITVTVYYGDLLQETTDGIVNAANNDLDHMGGVAYAISKARGPDMDRECRQYIQRNGNLKVSEVTHTSGGGKIKASHIIHAYGPMWLGEVSKDKTANQLRDTFLNCFNYAETKLWIKSLSTPAISTGVFGVPLDVCVRSFLDAVLIFIDKHKDGRLTDIRLVSNDGESTVTSIVLLQTLLDTGIDNLTAEAMESYRRFSDKSTMNLPRGRPESSDFSRSFKSPRQTSVTAGGSNHRRSSSTSRVSDRRRNDTEKGKTSVFDEKSNTFVEKDLSACKPDERGRSRTYSSTEKLSQKAYNVDVPRTSAGSERTKKGPPQIKQSLFSSKDRLTAKTHSAMSSKTEARTRTKALRVDDDLRSRRSPVSDSHDDNYTYKSTGSRPLHENEEDFGLHSLPVDFSHNSSFREKFLKLNSEEKADRKVNLCAICLDKVRKPKVLSKCGHTFCTGCIDEYFGSCKPKCPTCGTLYGELKGDQPKGGNMTYSTDRKLLIPGYEREDGTIVINYSFPSGLQESCHPQPGRMYKSMTRKAYLPNSTEGREVLRLLKKAFQARLTFTIGESRTTGSTDVITWNDIHHKTSVTGGPTKFGYPDSTYLKRVKEELASKGIQSV